MTCINVGGDKELQLKLRNNIPSYSTPGSFTTEMGDHLQVLLCNQSPRPTQPPAVSSMENEAVGSTHWIG